MKWKRLVSISFSVMLMAALLTTSASSAEVNPRCSMDTVSVNTGVAQMSPELRAYAERLMKKKNKPQSGQGTEKTVMSDGTILYVTAID